jgi:hypothetical protein
LQSILKTIESIQGTELVEIRVTTPKIHSADTPAVCVTNITLNVPKSQFDDLSNVLKALAPSLNVNLVRNPAKIEVIYA